MRKWISVHERLPEIDKPVLWYYPSGNMNVWELDKDEEFGRPGVYGKAVWPTHWMELPKPPKCESTGRKSLARQIDEAKKSIEKWPDWLKREGGKM